MKYSEKRKENELKDFRAFILIGIGELGLIDEPKFKTYGTMITKMYELNYYDKYEHILERVEEEALVEVIEFIIELIDEGLILEIKPNSNLFTLINSIAFIAMQKQYSNLAESLLELQQMIE
ncbi:hypothetical protein [Clostridioides difficile]|uniref:Uncharacterized protein n=1 Tax=Clostridioides difficile TaxID=1496 RepID=A0A2U9ADB5_CLODI|nr:hypothetical protein [Clostridioides difficile]AWO72472.1 hypothetical protein LBOJFJBN_00051 [Clostridioides difficile]MDL0272870.1 hypothetical protein [Clostridioides difficile]MDL0286699.1 hypothetical protein [Clostridioides difficile]